MINNLKAIRARACCLEVLIHGYNRKILRIEEKRREKREERREKKEKNDISIYY
jgi:hypothetical protein